MRPGLRTLGEKLRQRLTLAKRERLHAAAAVDAFARDGTATLRHRVAVAALAELDARIAKMEAAVQAHDAKRGAIPITPDSRSTRT